VLRAVAASDGDSGAMAPGDMYADIPTSDFSGAKTSDFVYLYAHFGNSDPKPIREWALVNVAPIPEMDALFPIIAFFGVAFATQRLRRRRSQQLSTT